MRGGATSEIAKPFGFVPSHAGGGFDWTSRTEQIRVRLVERLDLRRGRRAARRASPAPAARRSSSPSTPRATDTFACAARSAVTYAARRAAEALPDHRLLRLRARASSRPGLARLDEALEERAVGGLAIAGQCLQLLDRRVRDPPPADQALRAGRQQAQLAVLQRRVEAAARAASARRRATGARAHSQTHAAWPFSGSCSPTLHLPHPHDQTDAMPVSAATCLHRERLPLRHLEPRARRLEAVAPAEALRSSRS